MKEMLHELSEEFPELEARVEALKATSPEFAKLCDDYHEINQAVLRAENEIEPTNDEHLNQMRIQRMQLKDAIFAQIRA